MTTIGANKAKSDLPRLLDRAAKGEAITITRRGIPVAVLRQAEVSRCVDIRQTIVALKRFRGKNRLNDVSIKELVEEGRD